MEKADIEKNLFASDLQKYGDKYVEHLLEQYKIYLESAEKISERRQKTNEFFLALNSGLVTLLGFISAQSTKTNLGLELTVASIAGITICYLWYRIIQAYKALNDRKFKIIHAVESRLPLALYETEWKMLEQGENKKVYWPFSHIELAVPQIFIVIYVILLLSLIPWSAFLSICIYII